MPEYEGVICGNSSCYCRSIDRLDGRRRLVQNPPRKRVRVNSAVAAFRHNRPHSMFQQHYTCSCVSQNVEQLVRYQRILLCRGKGGRQVSHDLLQPLRGLLYVRRAEEIATLADDTLCPLRKRSSESVSVNTTEKNPTPLSSA